MGTRIWYETKLLNAYPEIRFVRMAYDRPNQAAVAYLADARFELPDKLKREVERFLVLEGYANLRHVVKPYSETHTDGIPELVEVPALVKQLALFGELTEGGIIQSLNRLFPTVDLRLAELRDHVLKVWLPSTVKLSPIEIQLVRDYTQELVPLNVLVEMI